jgi:hypothetical protein
MTISKQSAENAGKVWTMYEDANSRVHNLIKEHRGERRVQEWLAGLAYAFGSAPIEHLNLTGCMAATASTAPVLDAVGVAGNRIVWARCELDPGNLAPSVVGVYRLSDVVSLEVEVNDNVQQRAVSAVKGDMPTYAPIAAAVLLRLADDKCIPVRADTAGKDLDMVLGLIDAFAS